MSTFTPLKTDTAWFRLDVDDGDWRNEDPILLARLLEQVFLVRRFEEKLIELLGEGLVHGPVHTSMGQEGGAVGAMSVLDSADKINGTHRMHHQFLAKALNHKTLAGYDPRQAEFAEAMQEVVKRTMAEILGLSPGYNGGRGGSMHLKWDEAGVFGSNAIVGGNPPHAVGYAFADKKLGRDHISVCFFGDGASQTGAGFESMNLAALYDLPTIFFIENNLYAVSTHLKEQTRETRLSGRGLGLGVPGIECDGMDVVAVRRAMRWAVDEIRNRRGPVVIEAQTYRYLHQSGPLKGSNFGYRSREEEETWAGRDPFLTMPERLKRLGVVDQAGVERLDARARRAVDAAAGALTEMEPGTNKRRIVPALWPDPATVEHGIRGDLHELSGMRSLEVEDVAPERMKEIKLVEAIPMAMLHNMERYDGIYILGEDVHRLRGGTAGATRGIAERFPDRLIGTPIAENGFTGLAVGAALNGLRPVVEIMYPDFVLCAADQLFNQASKVRHMFGGDFPLPLVVRSRVAAGTGYGSQHSMDASGLFALYPGWRIVAASTPFDYIGLLNAAVRCDDPVLVVEYQSLFQTSGPVPVDDLDYIIPFGKAKVRRRGSACTALTYALTVPMTIEAAEETGIDAEVIDLRTLDPLGLDWETIEASVRKTGRLVIVEQTTRGTSIGAHIAKAAQERLFDWLDHEILHVSGTHASPVVSKVLEEAQLARKTDVVRGLRAIMGEAV
ncbi:MAG: thiamine pyrophosphate-dependent enzyme [Hyphomicrobiaceae bacterium]